MNKVDVLILMGSESDKAIMQKAFDLLKDFDLKASMKICSAHRSSNYLHELISEYKDTSVFIAGAGMAAHLAGVIASLTISPVIGVPLSSSPLNGQDALLSTVQMPSGIPVATVAIDGAKNAAFLAIEMLALSNPTLKEKLLTFRQNMETDIVSKNR